MKYAIIVIAIIAIIVIEEIAKNKTKTPSSPSQETQWDLSMYFLKSSILTERELKFYNQIKKLIPEDYVIAPKVGMKDFIEIKSKKDFMKHFGHISQKHIDFLICNKERLHPVLGIELDDLSHKQTSRAERDKMVNEIYNQIGLHVIHVPTNATETAIQNAINNIFTPKEEGPREA